ncbi:MAG TPA: hypothetical protein VFL83_11565 [Anaeromyxobacter sp.]|nr:hypothetical protein [Anaeromyxobacter sp.]
MIPSVENALPAASAAATPPSPRAGLPGPAATPDADLAAAAAVERDEGAAWGEVLAGWDDEDRHRAYLERFQDLDGLASAGRRYRGVLAERPGDPIAARFRDEVVRRAVAQGLASLPRTTREHPRARLAFRVAAGAIVGGLLLAAALLATGLLSGLAAGARP